MITTAFTPEDDGPNKAVRAANGALIDFGTPPTPAILAGPSPASQFQSRALLSSPLLSAVKASNYRSYSSTLDPGCRTITRSTNYSV